MQFFLCVHMGMRTLEGFDAEGSRSEARDENKFANANLPEQSER